MSHQEVLYHYLSTLYRLHEAIRLQLPPSQESLQRQVNQLHQAEADLERLQMAILSHLKRCRAVPYKILYQKLLPLIQQILRVAENYRILSEEFPLDPHGTMDCLECIQQRNQRLKLRLKALENRLLQAEQKSA